jgi:Flp pilus assembly protein TadG
MKVDYRLRRRVKLIAGRLLRPLRLRGEEGASLVELAIVLPLMLVVLTVAISFSLAFYNLQELENAVSLASQALGATAGVTATPCTQVVSQVVAALPGWTASSLTYKISITNAAGTATPYTWTGSSGSGLTNCDSSAGSGGAASTAEAAGEPQTVTVSYPYSWFAVFNWAPFGHLTPSSALTASESVIAD